MFATGSRILHSPNNTNTYTDVFNTQGICLAELKKDYLTLRSGIKTYGNVTIGSNNGIQADKQDKSYRKTLTVWGPLNFYSSDVNDDGTTKNFLTMNQSIDSRVDGSVIFRGNPVTLSTNETTANNQNWIKLDGSGTKINNNFAIGIRNGNNSGITEKFTVNASNGDTAISGTLSVNGNTTIGGTLSVNGDIETNNTLTDAAESSDLPTGKITLTSVLQTIRNNLKHLFNNKADKWNHTADSTTKCKITYNNQGIVTAGANLAAGDIPSLAISKITNLQTTLDGKQDSLNAGTGINIVDSVISATGGGLKVYYNGYNTEYDTEQGLSCEVGEAIVVVIGGNGAHRPGSTITKELGSPGQRFYGFIRRTLPYTSNNELNSTEVIKGRHITSVSSASSVFDVFCFAIRVF